MQMNRDQVAAAVNAGLALTDPESDLLDVFRKHASGIMMLRGLLQAIGTGNVALEPVKQPEAEKPPEPPKEPPVAKKKVARKKAAK